MAEVDVYVSKTQERRRRRRWYFFIGSIFISFFLCIVLILWIFFRSPFFRYSGIEVRGNKNVASADVVQLLLASYSDHSFSRKFFGIRSFFGWPKELSDNDLKLLPLLDKVEIHKDYWLHKLVLDVEEREPFGVWCKVSGVLRSKNTSSTEAARSSTGCWWFDESGFMFKRSLFLGEGGLLKVVSDYSGRNLALGSRILPDEFLPNMISVFKVILASGVGIKEVAIHDLENEEVEVLTYNGPKIYFSLRFPSNNDLAVLSSLMAKPGFSKFQYIDFRVENRAYYK